MQADRSAAAAQQNRGSPMSLQALSAILTIVLHRPVPVLASDGANMVPVRSRLKSDFFEVVKLYGHRQIQAKADRAIPGDVLSTTLTPKMIVPKVKKST